MQVQTSGKVSVRHRHRHAGPGALHQLRADRRRPARRRRARRRRGHRRHRPVLLGRRHLREPRRGGRRQRHPRGGDGGAREDPHASPPSISSAPRRTSSSPTARCASPACPASAIRLGELAAEGQSDARRGRARHRAGSRGDQLFRPAARRHRQRRPRHDRRGRPRDDDARDPQVRRRPRLRHGASTR